MPDAELASAVVKWEFMEFTRKTESYLINELNQFGELGWELASVIHRRDPKMGESYVWTAFLKRPKSGSSEAADAAKVSAVLQPSPVLETAKSGDGPELEIIDIFDVKEE
jgi:hypothetical protein